MKAQTKNLLHWSSEASLGGGGERENVYLKQQKKHRGFFVLFFFKKKKAKSESKITRQKNIKTILILQKNT